MKTLLAIVLAVCFIAAPGAIAGELSTADSDYLFTQESVEATTLSAQEMDATEGQLSVSLEVEADDELAAIGGLIGTLLSTVSSLPVLTL